MGTSDSKKNTRPQLVTKINILWNKSFFYFCCCAFFSLELMCSLTSLKCLSPVDTTLSKGQSFVNTVAWVGREPFTIGIQCFNLSLRYWAMVNYQWALEGSIYFCCGSSWDTRRGFVLYFLWRPGHDSCILNHGHIVYLPFLICLLLI